MAEDGSDLVRQSMAEADAWFTCRVAFVECSRAIGISADRRALRAFEEEWPAVGVVEVDQDLVESAADLAARRELRSLDALHLASALLVRSEDLALATWDRRLNGAARAEGLDVVPDSLG